MPFIEMTGSMLKRILSEDEAQLADLDSAGVEEQSIVRINQQGDIEIRRRSGWDAIGGLLGDFSARVQNETGLDWA